jgi:hypothetical protein
VFDVAMEAAKVVTAAWLSAKWRDVSRTFRLLLMALTFRGGKHQCGVYSQLVAAHINPRGAAAAGWRRATPSRRPGSRRRSRLLGKSERVRWFAETRDITGDETVGRKID